ncbi:Hypothetical protein SCLAV_p0177 (plasmid) [Streptomyces clavuligerus]|uniref:Uncharacterized protein n=1 Tax=Streptomyces clavuligerus TaxID=1901 RepID=D5SIC5_STRCL|nr:Hypothetical protein SCLAV_p0177 [Streptomyces clavuligerus]
MRPVDDVDYDQVPTERLPVPPKSVVREVLGEHWPSGWMLAKGARAPGTRGAARAGALGGSAAGRPAARCGAGAERRGDRPRPFAHGRAPRTCSRSMPSESSRPAAQKVSTVGAAASLTCQVHAPCHDASGKPDTQH